jgi:TRAP-type mannitol/chloroaromatic compound transport system permease large subunit
MYAGALIPGLMLTGLYCLYVFFVSIVRPAKVPALPVEARTLGGGALSLVVALVVGALIAFAANYLLQDRIENGAAIWAATIAVALVYFAALFDKLLGTGVLSRLAQQVIIVLIPPLALIFLVLGTIFLGIATPTEGGAMGATGALILAFAKRRLDFKTMSDALEATTRLACFVMFILIGSRIFSLTFYGINGHIWVEELFTALPGGEWGFLIAVNVLVFILGCFIDFFEIAFIVVPLLAPVAVKFGVDLVWFGVVLGVNLQTSFLTPPFGFALFYMRSVAPAAAWYDKVSKRTIAGVSTLQIYRGAVSFIILQSIMIVVVLLFPRLSIPEAGPVVDPSTIEIELPPMGGEGEGQPELPPLDLGEPPEINPQ